MPKHPASLTSQSWKETALSFLKAAAGSCRLAHQACGNLLFRGWKARAWLHVHLCAVTAQRLGERVAECWGGSSWRPSPTQPRSLSIPFPSDCAPKDTFWLVGDHCNAKRTLSNTNSAAVCRSVGIHASLHIQLREWCNFHAFTHMEAIMSHYRCRSPMINVQKVV